MRRLWCVTLLLIACRSGPEPKPQVTRRPTDGKISITYVGLPEADFAVGSASLTIDDQPLTLPYLAQLSSAGDHPLCNELVPAGRHHVQWLVALDSTREGHSDEAGRRWTLTANLQLEVPAGADVEVTLTAHENPGAELSKRVTLAPRTRVTVSGADGGS